MKPPLDYAPDDEPIRVHVPWRPVIILFSIQIAIIGAFAWVMWR